LKGIRDLRRIARAIRQREKSREEQVAGRDAVRLPAREERSQDGRGGPSRPEAFLAKTQGREELEPEAKASSWPSPFLGTKLKKLVTKWRAERVAVNDLSNLKHSTRVMD